MLSWLKRILSTHKSIKLNVLVYEEDNEWIAHCLQMDIVTTNTTKESVQDDIVDLIRAHLVFAIENNNIGNIFKSAPPEDWEKYFNSRASECNVRKLYIPLPRRDENIKSNPVKEVEFCFAA